MFVMYISFWKEGEKIKIDPKSTFSRFPLPLNRVRVSRRTGTVGPNFFYFLFFFRKRKKIQKPIPIDARIFVPK